MRDRRHGWGSRTGWLAGFKAEWARLQEKWAGLTERWTELRENLSRLQRKWAGLKENRIGRGLKSGWS